MLEIILGIVFVYWLWFVMFGCSDLMGIGCVFMFGCSGLMGIGCVWFWFRIFVIVWDICCNCLLESNDVVVCVGVIGLIDMGVDWVWGLVVIVLWWCLGCFLDFVVGWVGFWFFFFGMLNCLECKYKIKIY